MPRLKVVLRQFLACLGGRRADDRILIGIVVRFALEDLETDGPLLHAASLVLQIRLHHVTQKGLATLAGTEMRTGQKAIELASDHRRIGRWLACSSNHGSSV